MGLTYVIMNPNVAAVFETTTRGVKKAVSEALCSHDLLMFLQKQIEENRVESTTRGVKKAFSEALCSHNLLMFLQKIDFVKQFLAAEKADSTFIVCNIALHWRDMSTMASYHITGNSAVCAADYSGKNTYTQSQ